MKDSEGFFPLNLIGQLSTKLLNNRKKNNLYLRNMIFNVLLKRYISDY